MTKKEFIQKIMLDHCISDPDVMTRSKNARRGETFHRRYWGEIYALVEGAISYATDLEASFKEKTNTNLFD